MREPRSTGGRAALAATAALVLAVACPTDAAPGRRADAAPRATEAQARALRAHTLRLLDGRTLTLGALQGQVVVVNFWATWCRPCRKELPALETMNAELSRRGARVVAVSIDEDPANVRRFARQHRLSLPIAVDGPDGLARILDLPHVPYTLVLDRTGVVAMTSRGSNAAELDAIAARARALSDKTPVAAHEGETTP